MRRGRHYDKTAINGTLERVLAEIGPERFAAMRLLELETLIRQRDPDHSLPGKTLLREAINAFRSARWPSTAPKRMSDRFRG